MLSPTVYDTFNRTVSGGFGTSLSGHAWTSTVGADSSVTPATTNTPGLGLHTCTTTGIRISTVGPNVTDSDVRFGWGLSAVPTGANAIPGSVARFTNTSNYYYFAPAVNTDKSVSAQIRKVVAGVDTLLSTTTVSGLTFSAAGRYWARAKVVGTTLQFKVWSDATGEPLTWTLTATDSALASAGQVGVRSEKPAGNSNASIAFSYSYFTCGPYADAAGKALAYDLEVAWGADITTDAATWPWTPITSDIYLGNPDDPQNANSPAIACTFGRSDWAGQAQPATLAATLNAIGAKYAAYNPTSPNYPNVVRNTPVRERVCYSIVRFFGFTNGWPPTWDLVTNQPTVALTASGVLRRLNQGTILLRSALRRYITTQATLPLAYWHMEDKANAVRFDDGLGGTNHMPIPVPGAIPLAQTVGPGGSDTLPSMGGQPLTVTGYVPPAADDFWSVVFVAQISAVTSPGVAITLPLWLTPGGSPWVKWWLQANNNFKNIQLVGEHTDGITDDLILSWTPPSGSIYDGLWHDYRVTASQSGGTIAVELWVDGVQVATAAPTATNTHITTISPMIQFGLASQPAWSLGHLGVYHSTSPPSITAAAGGWVGETATARITRLCTENAIPVTVSGTDAAGMGPQSVKTLIELLKECEDTDLGALFDGQGSGLAYIAHVQRQNVTASLTVDASLEQLSAPFQPMDDDQRIRNRWTVSRVNGSFATASDDDPRDALSTKRSGIYPDSTTVNVATDPMLLDQASWRVHMGITEGFRYPTLPIDLFRNPEIGGAWLDVDLLSRVDVTNLPAPHPLGAVSLVVEGYTEAVGDFAWDVVANCSPYRPWEVFQVQDTRLGRLDTDGSILEVSASSGASTLTVGTNVSEAPVWDVAAPPFDIEVEGEQITATAISNLATDAFNRTVASGWGTADSGQVWSISTGTAADFSANGSNALMTHSATLATHSIRLPLGVVNQDITISPDTNIGSVVGGNLVAFFDFRFVDANNMFRLNIRWKPAGNATAELVRILAGVSTVLAAETDIPSATSTSSLTVRMQAIGTVATGVQLRAKAWPAGQAVPGWLLVATDFAIDSPGDFRCSSFRDTGNTNNPSVFRFEDLAVTNPQKFTVTRSVNGVVKAHGSAATVKLWRPGVIAL